MIDFSFYTEEGHLINSFERICQFDVYADVEERGMFRMEHQWKFQPDDHYRSDNKNKGQIGLFI